MERFIRFNNELIETEQILHFERLARAWMNHNEFTLTERQLVELNPADATVAISVFWRHRAPRLQHAGRITDVLLLTLGFYKNFSLRDFQEFREEFADHPQQGLLTQLVFLLEEFRFSQQIMATRKGTKKWFSLRQEATIPFYHQQMVTYQKRSFLSDALVFYIALSLYEGTLSIEHIEEFSPLLPLLRSQRQLRSTQDSIDLALAISYQLQDYLRADCQLRHFQHLVLRGSEFTNFTYHRGIKKEIKGTDQEKESVEEMMQMWHQENEDEQGMHLRFEIEHGRDSDLANPDGAVEEGRDDHEPTSIGLGKSSARQQENYDFDLVTKSVLPKIHAAVEKIENHVVVKDSTDLQKIVKKRIEQAPYVKQLVTLFQKEIAKKTNEQLTGLVKGRLQKNLLPLWLEERPRLFYRNGQQSKELDAVFYLLVDGSASMQDKLEETKAAVLYVHDVLRQLRIPHQIVQHYEDAYDATDTYQPNYFEILHDYTNFSDSAFAVYAMEAHEDNRDGYALRIAAESLLARKEQQKFLLYFSDGEPSAFDYREQGIVDTADAVQGLTKSGIAFLHLFLSDAPVSEEQRQLFATIYGKRTAATDSIDQFTSEAHRLLKRMLQQLIQVTV